MSEQADTSARPSGAPLRVGVDLVAVDDVADALRRFGTRYAARLFTPAERRDTAGAAQAEGLAARFAAKEATIKALGAGDDAPGWRSVEIRRGPSGAPRLVLHGEAADLARSAGLRRWAVSLAHEGPVAVAVVVADGPEPTRTVTGDRPAPDHE